MNPTKSFKGYGKVDNVEDQAFHRKTRKRLIIVTFSSLLLIGLVVGAVAGILIHKRNSDDGIPSSSVSPAQSIKAVCNVTPYPDACFSSISALHLPNTTDPEEIFKLSLQVAIAELSKLPSLPDRLAAKSTDPRIRAALAVCQTVLEDAVDFVNDSISSMAAGKSGEILSAGKIEDVRTWLSTAVTDQETCLDALREMNSSLVDSVAAAMRNSSEYTSNSLAIVAKILGILKDFDLPIHRRRRLLAESGSDSGYPEWVGAGVRRLLQEERLTPDVTVAKDGTGDYKTIKEAAKAVPKKSEKRFVIYVKAGKYVENVDLDKHRWNVMIYGDGSDKTILSGSLNFIDGTPTYATATFAVMGKGFIARDIRFENTAGAAKHQAVALRSGSDCSVFYRCSFDGFQDTLYPHSNRQFFRDCDVTGTIDFIFGGAAAVFQNCNIRPRKPLPNQFNTITAQGKKEPEQKSAFSLQHCNLTPLGNFTEPTYLGRPWKNFSTTVIIQSFIGPFLQPVGWIEWVKGVNPPDTIFYGEYQNTGAGSAVDKRVTWAGYYPSITAEQAGKFSVEYLLEGGEWLPDAKVAFNVSI
ncbi:pectinesterase 3 [Malania oleifera]|uniref:pectinesterase 3 n=1 Tax=Malania oleifera TaxID=397392 RepID=UPI0025ADA8B8|nr:pectinesterase 3 [Malania oleifera]